MSYPREVLVIKIEPLGIYKLHKGHHEGLAGWIDFFFLRNVRRNTVRKESWVYDL